MTISPDDDFDSPADQRASPRIALMMRAAKLICDDVEYLCVLRDVSTSGIKARLFHGLPNASNFELEIANGDRLRVEPVWERGGHAGFRFAIDEATIHTLLDEAGDYPRRQLRLRVDMEVALAAQGMAFDAVMLDLAQHGAKLVCSNRFALGQPIAVEGSAFSPLAARVRWRRGLIHGLVFHTGFRLDSLAELVFRINQRRPAHEQPLRTGIDGKLINQ